MNFIKRICPKCGSKRFVVRAILDQEWIVDEHGIHRETLGSEVATDWETGDVFCAECGCDVTSSKLETQAYNVTISFTTSRTFKVDAMDADEAVDKAARELDWDDSPISYVVENENGNLVDEGSF